MSRAAALMNGAVIVDSGLLTTSFPMLKPN